MGEIGFLLGRHAGRAHEVVETREKQGKTERNTGKQGQGNKETRKQGKEVDQNVTERFIDQLNG